MNQAENKKKFGVTGALLTGNLLLLSTVLGVSVLRMDSLATSVSNNQKNITQLQNSRQETLDTLVGSVDKLNQQNQKSLAQLIRLHSNIPKTIQKQIQLKKAYILPHPPHNRGRLISYESLEKRTGQDGLKVVVFQERRGAELVRTEVPASEIKWQVK